LPSDEFAEKFALVLDDYPVQQYLRVNQYDDMLWLNKEQLERLAAVLVLISEAQADRRIKATTDRGIKNVRKILECAADCGYQVEKIIKQLTSPPTAEN
jgi:hypothetical protein